MKLKTLAIIATVALNLVPARGQDFASVRKSADAGEVPPPSVTLGGIMVSNDYWTDNSQAGVYSLEARPDGKITPIKHVAGMADVASALHRGTVLYAVEANVIEGFFYRTYSTSTWSGGTRQEIDVENVPSDLTWDPVTEKAYGGFYDATYNGYSRFASFGLTTAEASDIKNANRDERDIFAIAADGKGKIYALFGAFNYLVTLDPKTGAAERIGRTGLSPELNLAEGRVSSMCYDEVNDRLLAAVYTEDGYGTSKTYMTGLYEINVETGAATLLYEIPGSACFAGLYVMSTRPADTAPAVATGLKVSFGDVPTRGTIEFDAPKANVTGAALTGTLFAIVDVNGTETVLRGINPGEHVSVPDIDFINGDNTVKVTMADSKDRGEGVAITFWAGEDVPLPVDNVHLEVENGVASLSWTAPAAGANGGGLIADNLRYTITRYPDKKVVASDYKGTSFADNTIDTSWKALYYTVSCSNSQGEAAAVASNKCPASGSLTVPFAETFDTADDFDIWTVINVNGGSTWEWDRSGKRARYEYNRENLAGDDWLVSPPVALEAGRIYKVGYSYRAYNKSYAENFEVMLGEAPEVNSLKRRLAVHEGIVNTVNEHAETSFSVETDGKYYIAFHNYSAPKMWSLYIDDITIDALDSRVPAQATEVCVTPGGRGALEAEISFVTPSKDADGGTLVSLESVKVYRNGVSDPIATIANPATGKALSVKDSDIAAAGTYTYSVICANSIGEGVAATAAAFVGVDAPGKVGDLVIAQDEAGHAALSWTAPQTGANGGWFDPAAVSYRIVRSDGTLLEENFEGLSYTDTKYTAPSASQENVWYLVTPYCGKVKGTYAQTSEIFLFGKPYAAPAAETFGGADMVYYPWMAQSSNAVVQAWTLDPAGVNPVASDQSGDRGLATFHSVGEPVGTVSYFYSPMFSIAALDAPVLSFWMYHSPSIEGDASLKVLCAADGDSFEAELATVARAAGSADGWVRHTVALDAYKEAKSLRFAFVGTGDAAADIYLDNVAVENLVATDAAVTAFSAPRRIARGMNAELDVKVLNAGSQELKGISVNVKDASGKELGTKQIESLASGAEIVVSFATVFDAVGSINLTAEAVADGDARADNNTAKATVEVVEPVLRAPENLSATISGDNIQAIIGWTAVEYANGITDDVESYPAWAIDGIGDWTMHDGDYDVTYYINKDAGQYPNATGRKAFQVLDVNKLGIDIWDEGKAHSGNKLFAALAGVNYVNDDWLISPRLNGGSQMITFYARSFTTDDVAPERMRVLYSTTDSDPAHFTALTSGYVSLDGNWQQYKYLLPEGTRYFAINCVSDGSFAMFVDDISFNDLTVPDCEVEKYEIFRNGELLDSSNATEFTDAFSGKATYTVRAVYAGYGPGPMSEPIEVDYAGVSLTETPAEVEITGIYTPAGVEVHGTPDKGVYIVRYSDGSVRKLTF